MTDVRALLAYAGRMIPRAARAGQGLRPWIKALSMHDLHRVWSNINVLLLAAACHDGKRQEARNRYCLPGRDQRSSSELGARCTHSAQLEP